MIIRQRFESDRCTYITPDSGVTPLSEAYDSLVEALESASVVVNDILDVPIEQRKFMKPSEVTDDVKWIVNELYEKRTIDLFSERCNQVFDVFINNQ